MCCLYCLLQYLSQCDQVILLRDGMVQEKGTHTQLLDKGGEYATLIITFHSQPTEGKGILQS